jgi:hypothetical protein
MYGVLIDTKTDRNVTEQRMRKLTALNVKDLPPLNMAIKRVKRRWQAPVGSLLGSHVSVLQEARD